MKWKFFSENNLAKLIHIIRNIDIPIIIKDGWSKEWSLEKENASSGWFFGWFLMNFSEKKIVVLHKSFQNTQKSEHSVLYLEG